MQGVGARARVVALGEHHRGGVCFVVLARWGCPVTSVSSHVLVWIMEILVLGKRLIRGHPWVQVLGHILIQVLGHILILGHMWIWGHILIQVWGHVSSTDWWSSLITIELILISVPWLCLLHWRLAVSYCLVNSMDKSPVVADWLDIIVALKIFESLIELVAHAVVRDEVVVAPKGTLDLPVCHSTDEVVLLGPLHEIAVV